MALRSVHWLAAVPVLVTLAFLVRPPAAHTTAPAATDVLFVFDTTGSMTGALSEAKGQAADVMTSLDGRLPHLRFGVAQVRDHGDHPLWRVEQTLTPDAGAAGSAIAELVADGGGDLPEAYGTALRQSMETTVGWAPEAKHLVVLVADDVPHDDDLNEGVPAEIANRPSPWNTGVDPDAGGATIDWQQQLAAFADADFTLAFVLYHGVTAYLPYWNWWAGRTGGRATQSTDSTPLGDVLVDIVTTTASACQSAGEEEPPQCDADEAPAFSGDTPELPAAPEATDSIDPDAPNDGPISGSCPEPGPTEEPGAGPQGEAGTNVVPIPPEDPWFCPDSTSTPAVLGVTWSQSTDAITFRNADGTWVVYKRCIDRMNGGLRENVGPGYVARLARGGTRIVDDFRGRSDVATPGFLNAVNGGLGTFGWHHARGPVNATPAGDDPTTAIVETSVGRSPQVIEGRMCAATNDGHGVYARNWHGPTRASPTRVDYTMDVWFRDRYGDTGFGPGGNAIARIRYRYSFYRSSVSLWALVSTYAKPNAAGTPFVKEPKFTALTRGGGYVRMAVFGGPDGRTFLEGATGGEPEGTAVLNTEHAPQDARVRVRWDFATRVDAEGNSGCTAVNPCLNVVARSFPTAPGPAGIRRVEQAANWEGAALGLDRWGVVSGERAKAYPRDTRGDASVSMCKAPRIAADGNGKLNEVELSRASERATPAMDQVREWELAGWKTGPDSRPYQAALTLFPGWENGRGGWDCEPLQRSFGSPEESWGSYFSYSLSDGWKLSG